MWTCMTLYNRPQVCFTPELQPEWLIALMCIFVGCICITTTIILLASSNWDRDVIPYARWVGFTASEWLSDILLLSKRINVMLEFHCSSGFVLFGSSHLPAGLPHRRDRWATLSVAQLPSGRNLIHYVRAGTLDYGDFRVVCGQSVFATFLDFDKRFHLCIIYWFSESNL